MTELKSSAPTTSIINYTDEGEEGHIKRYFIILELKYRERHNNVDSEK